MQATNLQPQLSIFNRRITTRRITTTHAFQGFCKHYVCKVLGTLEGAIQMLSTTSPFQAYFTVHTGKCALHDSPDRHNHYFVQKEELHAEYQSCISGGSYVAHSPQNTL